MYVPNENYCKFEEFFLDLYEEMAQICEKSKENFTPSKMIELMGKKIDHKESIYYWCYKNMIPVFCPGITDGGIGDALFF